MDLYASVGGGFKRFHVESVSGEVVQGEGAVIIDGDNKPFLIKDMVTSTDVVNIYVLTSGDEPRVLTFFRDLLSGGLRHRDTSPNANAHHRVAHRGSYSQAHRGPAYERPDRDVHRRGDRRLGLRWALYHAVLRP